MRNRNTRVLLITTRLLLMALAAIAVLTACGGSGAATLQDTAWELESLGGNDLIPGTTITLKFEGEQKSGSAGCNQYGGGYQASADSLSFGDTFATEMACMEPESVMDQEIAYLTALGTAATYQVAGDRLEVYDDAGTQILVFALSGELE